MDRSRIILLLAHPTQPEVFQGLASFLEACRFDVQTRPADTKSCQCVLSMKPDVVFVEHTGPSSGAGLELARKVKGTCPSVPVILATKGGSEELAVAALRAGLQDYLTLPIAPEDMLAAVERNLGERTPVLGLDGRVVKAERHAGQMIGTSDPMREVRARMCKAAASNCTALITGETGTGKELAAEFIHNQSARRNKPLVPINCAAIPDSLLESELFGHTRGAFTGADDPREGLLKAADGGTIFFDEIGDMSLIAQAKILRVIERGEVCKLGGTQRTQLDVRFIAATNQDLQVMSSRGNFRRDLYFRLSVALVHLPPLRERKEDIPMLVEYFRNEFGSRQGSSVPEISEECLECLLKYDWPGNIRELKNVIENMFLGEVPTHVGAGHLPRHLTELIGRKGGELESERERLLSALLFAKWNKSKAAAKLHWSRMTVYRKIEKYAIAKGTINESEHCEERRTEPV